MNDIVGVWRLIRSEARNEAGGIESPPFGPKPMGLVEFHTDGRMIAVLCDGRSEIPKGEPPREYNSYTGAYSYDGTTLVTRVDGATELARIGGDQIRAVSFDGNRMTLKPPRRPRNGMLQDHELVWEPIA
jgi:hypothetical protein